jgi:hypothetical protein
MKTSLLFLAVAAACMAQQQPAVWYQLDYFRTQPAADKSTQHVRSLYRVWFTGTASEYNFVSLTRFSDYTEIVINPRVRTGVVRTDILGQVAIAGSIATPWLSVNFIKSSRGMEQDRQNDEAKFWKPIHEAQLKAGRKSYKGWFAASVRWPSGPNAEYDIVSADAYDAFGLPEEGGLEAEVAEANRNTAQHGVTVRRELWELIGAAK